MEVYRRENRKIRKVLAGIKPVDFKPQIGSNWIVGVVGVLQLDVVVLLDESNSMSAEMWQSLLSGTSYIVLNVI